MIGRTNALVRALVSSVNGMSGVVELNANIVYDPTEEYEEGTIGEALQDFITETAIDTLFPEDPDPDVDPEQTE